LSLVPNTQIISPECESEVQHKRRIFTTQHSGLFRSKSLVGQAHTASGFSAQVNSDAQKVCGASRFATFATNTVLGSRRWSNLLGFAAVPGNHLQYVSRASPDALSAANTGIVDFYGMWHGIKTPNEAQQCDICIKADNTSFFESKLSLPHTLSGTPQNSAKL